MDLLTAYLVGAAGAGIGALIRAVGDVRELIEPGEPLVSAVFTVVVAVVLPTLLIAAAWPVMVPIVVLVLVLQAKEKAEP